MNVLLIITKSEIGGAQRFVQEQIALLKENGHQPFLVTNRADWLTQVVAAQVVKFGLHAGIESKCSIGFFIYLYQFITKHQIDLVICNSANAGLYGRLVGFLTPSKSIYVTHGWSSVYNGGKFAGILNFVEKILSYIGDSVLCISQNDYELAVNKIGVAPRNLHLIPNAILPKNKISAPHQNAPLKVLMVCRIDHPKRPDLLIKSVQKIGNKIELTIIGSGSQFNALQALVKSEDHHIILKGEVLGFDQYEEYDVFALISLSEGLPISALEGMAAGLALVLSNVGGCSALIDHNGVLVENNVDDITSGLIKVMSDVELYKANSLKLFNSKFNLLNNAHHYLSYYHRVLNKS